MASIFNDYVQAHIKYGGALPIPVKRKPMTPNSPSGYWNICIAIRHTIQRWDRTLGRNVISTAIFYQSYTKSPSNWTKDIKTRSEHKRWIVNLLRRNGLEYLGEIPSKLEN